MYQIKEVSAEWELGAISQRKDRSDGDGPSHQLLLLSPVICLPKLSHLLLPAEGNSHEGGTLVSEVIGNSKQFLQKWLYRRGREEWVDLCERRWWSLRISYRKQRALLITLHQLGFHNAVSVIGAEFPSIDHITEAVTRNQCRGVIHSA